MNHRYSKHYTRAEANALLPEIRRWLEEISRFREDLEKYDKRLRSLSAGGKDIGGDLVNTWVKAIAATKAVLNEFSKRQILVKDIERGLIDFPAVMGGKEVFLCWEKDEDSVEFWHDLDSGYAGRERL